MPHFDSGVYVITNCLQKNNAALLNDNDCESVRGVPPTEGELRDNEKVSITSILCGASGGPDQL